MEDLLSSLGGIEVTSCPNNPHAEHPHFALYKVKATGSSQDERRKMVLQARKEARYDLLSLIRNIDEASSDVTDDNNDDMECEQVRSCYARPKKFRNFLMLSEWLVDVPENFCHTHLAVPCPVGKRCLVMAARGRTRAYAKSGVMVREFPTMLPGGNRHICNRGFALLDCIWSEVNKTYYVLDLIMWLNQSILESETQFRLEWLKSRMEEEAQEVQETSRLNPFRFQRVPYYDCSPETLQRLMAEEMPFSVPLDGILFYHKESHYTHGTTPLVGWLKGYMFPEILGIPVPESVLMEKPLKYVNLPSHIQYGEEKRNAKKNEEKMEVSSAQGQKKKNKKTTKSKLQESKMEVSGS
ncbi:snurportin-1-like [Eriocheir sinensis]|uniref:snurportin-1-like n=1 Tax=Eriocheir sinensis TaxID=95602 RepID=UPI0021C5D0E7|nr:snurportin-1-like [Eriocheir sinensis]XP_050699085.1 snurportin-1-like [Eriocheir sinensis]XP_050699086.1 snurportin-1-like [Eriocheir sinensis]